MVYLLAAIGLTSGGSSTVHIYTIHKTTQQLWLEGFLGFQLKVVKLTGKSAGRARLCELYTGICLTTEEYFSFNYSSLQ